jgi:hypothetical protein
MCMAWERGICRGRGNWTAVAVGGDQGFEAEDFILKIAGMDIAFGCGYGYTRYR